MKTQTTNLRRRGFTLVELLVVIAIIAVLAALGFAGVTAAIKKARTTQGNVAAISIRDAVDRFVNEYNRLPDIPATQGTPIQTDQADGIQLLQVLLAEETAPDPDNRRRIAFLDLPQAKANKGGLVYGAGGTALTGLFDPFGNPYQILLNVDYEDRMLGTFNGATGGGTRQVDVRRQNVVVFSPGADKEAGTPDDIRTVNN